MTVETLTVGDRIWLRANWCNSQHAEGHRALRIIDALTAEIERLRAECARLRDGNTFLSRELGRAQSDADSERCERVQLEETDNAQLAESESRLVEATAENERLRAELNAMTLESDGLHLQCDKEHNAWVCEQKRSKAAEARLVEATGLLTEWLETADEQELNASPYEGTTAFLANQPAAPVVRLGKPRIRDPLILPDDDEPASPTRTEAEPLPLWSGRGNCPFCLQPHERTSYCSHRAKAEQAVLTTSRSVDETWLRRVAAVLRASGRDDDGLLAWCDAELARRGLK